MSSRRVLVVGNAGSGKTTLAAALSDLPMLVDWVRGYSERRDACSLAAHRALYDAFDGATREVLEVVDGRES